MVVRLSSWRALLLESCVILAGGVAGTLARVLVSVTLARWLDAVVPLDIALINVSGSFLLGVFAGWRDRASRRHEILWLGGAVGFIGAYTTFSSFVLGVVTLSADGKTLLGLIYLGLSVVLGILAVEGGLWLGERLQKRM
jgi:fluoride exporter